MHFPWPSGQQSTVLFIIPKSCAGRRRHVSAWRMAATWLQLIVEAKRATYESFWKKRRSTRAFGSGSTRLAWASDGTGITQTRRHTRTPTSLMAHGQLTRTVSWWKGKLNISICDVTMFTSEVMHVIGSAQNVRQNVLFCASLTSSILRLTSNSTTSQLTLTRTAPSKSSLTSSLIPSSMATLAMYHSRWSCPSLLVS